MNKEIWRDVKGYEGLYQVSSEGRVKSLKRKGRRKERILKHQIDRNGYLRLNLCAGGKSRLFFVHRLVCQAFHENPDNNPCVNHIDENKTNNAASNLEWCTYEENINHGTRNERASKPVGQYSLEGKLIKLWPSLTEVKRQTGFSQGNISEAANGNRKQAYGFIWKCI